MRIIDEITDEDFISPEFGSSGRTAYLQVSGLGDGLAQVDLYMKLPSAPSFYRVASLTQNDAFHATAPSSTMFYCILIGNKGGSSVTVTVDEF